MVETSYDKTDKHFTLRSYTNTVTSRRADVFFIRTIQINPVLVVVWMPLKSLVLFNRNIQGCFKVNPYFNIRIVTVVGYCKISYTI